MDIFLARQPIFDRSNKVIAYELLFRNSCENIYCNTDGNEATLNVIVNSFYTFGIKNITNNKKVFINFTEELIKKEIVTLLPSEQVVVEILENIEPTDEIILACKKLKEKGYTLALDDFVFDEKYIKLIKLIDIIKVDFKITKGYERKRLFELLKINHKIKFLAEKVENKEEYNEAFKMGYIYFQGYYFSKPVVLSRKSIFVHKNIGLKILKLINKEEFSFRDLEVLIMKDLGLSYKIMKLINSSVYYLRSKVSSIRQAITFLGEIEIRKWLYIILLNDLKGNNTNELIRVSLQRAKLCEFICGMSIHKEKKFSAYMTGLFSVVDAILNCPIKVIISDLCIVDEVKDGLLEEKSPLNAILRLVINYENGEWENVGIYAEEIGIGTSRIPSLYIESLRWADNILCN
jgi:c-di-GMP-related signal transduction protein